LSKGSPSSDRDPWRWAVSAVHRPSAAEQMMAARVSGADLQGCAKRLDVVRDLLDREIAGLDGRFFRGGRVPQ